MSRTVQYDMEGNEVYNSAWPDEMNYEEEGDDEMEVMKALQEQFKQKDDMVNEPSHYKHGQFEVIDEMLMIFGWEATVSFCKINAWKYRARAPYKGRLEEDMKKADRYMEYAREIELRNNPESVNLLKHHTR